MPKIELHLGDCLEKMKDIPDGSIDAVICDPPYGTTACKGDSVIPLEPMWEQLKRVIKPNGAIVLFGSQPFTSALVMSNSTMFRHNWVWDKGRGVGHLLAKKRPLMTTEDILVFYEDLTDRKQKVESFAELRTYFKTIFQAINTTKKNIIENIGQRVDHCFRFGSTQWDLPTEETYNTLIDFYKIDRIVGFLDYSDLREKYRIEENCFKDLTYNPQMRDRVKSRVSKMKNTVETCYGDLPDYIGDVLVEKYPVNLIFFSKSGHKDMLLHPNQKPVALMEYLIKTYTNEGETVLDFAAGSGTAGVACKNLNRNFIGIELDQTYFDIATKRIGGA